MTAVAPAEYLLISGSLRPFSFSRVLAETMARHYAKLGTAHRLIDLRDFVLPLCDGGAAYANPHVETLVGLVSTARVIIVAAPIYNYDVSAAVKNLIELTGGAWEHKIVGFLCAAGGPSSYMSVMSLANSLMLDFRCLVIPRFVYAQKDDFTEEKQPGEALLERIQSLAEASTKIRYAI